MKHKLIYSEKSLKDLKKLEKKTAKRILSKLVFFAAQKDPLKYAKALKNTSIGEYRFRVGRYRILFDTDKKGDLYILLILRVKHRREVYNLN